MNTLLLQGIAFILMLLALPLASIGTVNEMQMVSVLALSVIAIGGITPPILKFVGDTEDDGEDEDQ